MDAAPLPGSPTSPHAKPDLHRWAALLAEMSELHAKLEYALLMMRMERPATPASAPGSSD